MEGRGGSAAASICSSTDCPSSQDTDFDFHAAALEFDAADAASDDNTGFTEVRRRKHIIAAKVDHKEDRRRGAWSDRDHPRAQLSAAHVNVKAAQVSSTASRCLPLCHGLHGPY